MLQENLINFLLKKSRKATNFIDYLRLNIKLDDKNSNIIKWFEKKVNLVDFDNSNIAMENMQ